MKRSPFLSIFQQLSETIIDLTVNKFKKAVLDKKLYKEINEVICKVEDRFKENEMNAHAPQELTNYMVKVYSKTYDAKKNTNPEFDLNKFYTSQKGKQFVDSFSKNNCYTTEEEVRMMNAFGLLPGQDGKWHYDDKTLEEIFKNKETEFRNLPEDKYPHSEISNIKLSEFKDFACKYLTPIMCEFDKTVYERCIDKLSSEKFIARLHDDQKTVYDTIQNTLKESLSKDEQIELVKHTEALQYEEDARGNKKMRSILSTPLTYVRNFSSLASYSVNKHEARAELSKNISEINRKVNGSIEKMSTKYSFVLMNKSYTGKALCDAGTVQGNIEEVQQIREENAIKIEYDAKLENIEDIKKFGKEQFEVINKALDPKSLNIDYALSLMSTLCDAGVYRLFPEEIQKINAHVKDLCKNNSDEKLKQLYVVTRFYSKQEDFIKDLSKISYTDANFLVSKARNICENKTLVKRGIKDERVFVKLDPVRNSPNTYNELKEIRDRMMVDKDNQLKALEKQNNFDSGLAKNAISKTYDEQINMIDKFISAAEISSTADLDAKNPYELLTANIKESANRIEDIIKHASTEELKGILQGVEEANSLGICKDTCNFIVEEVKTYRSEDITYTDNGKFVVEDRIQEEVLERTITNGN